MANMIPAASAEFETSGSTGNFVAWFDCTVAQSTLQALAGTGSMEVTATGASMGVQQDNWPGFPVTGGQDVGISASAWKANPGRTVTVEFDWRDEGGTSQLTSSLTLNVGGSAWVTESATVAVPGTVTRLFITITWPGSSSDIVYFDSLQADDEPGGGGTPQSKTHTDAVGLSDTIEAAATRSRTLADDVGLTDDVVATWTRARAIVDAVGATDTLATGGSGQKTHADSVGLTDAVEAVFRRSAEIVDNVGLVDDASPAWARSRAVTDDLGVVDSASRVLVMDRAVTDSVGLVDRIPPEFLPIVPEVLTLVALPDILTLRALED